MASSSTPIDITPATGSRELVKVTVVGSRRTYQVRWVPEDQLRKHSTFLEWHSLPATINAELSTFYAFSHWLYGRRLKKLYLDITQLMDAWLLGMKYQAVNFQNIVMIELLRNHRRGEQVLPIHVGMAYSKTRPESPLRFLVVDLYRDLPDGEKRSNRWRRLRGRCDVDFLADVSGEGRVEDGARAMKRSGEYMV